MPEPSTPRARIASHTLADGAVAGSWLRPNGAIMIAAHESCPIDTCSGGYADEAHADPDQPRPGDALRDIHLRGQDDGEDRRGRLDHRGQAGVEVRLGEAEQPEGDGIVERAQHDDRPEVAAKGRQAASIREDEEEHEQRQRSEDEAPERNDRRLERLHSQLDEQERRSPDRREEQQE